MVNLSGEKHMLTIFYFEQNDDEKTKSNQQSLAKAGFLNGNITKEWEDLFEEAEQMSQNNLIFGSGQINIKNCNLSTTWYVPLGLPHLDKVLDYKGFFNENGDYRKVAAEGIKWMNKYVPPH